jgi:hypothetical protein
MPRIEFDDDDPDDLEEGRTLPPLPSKPLRGSARDPKPKRDQVSAGIDAIAAYKTAFEARATNELDRVVLSTDSGYWVAMCFESRTQKEAFLQRLNLSDMGDKHIDGIEVARRLGVPFSKEERVVWPKRRGFNKLAKLAADEDDPTKKP